MVAVSWAQPGFALCAFGWLWDAQEWELSPDPGEETSWDSPVFALSETQLLEWPGMEQELLEAAPFQESHPAPPVHSGVRWIR